MRNILLPYPYCGEDHMAKFYRFAISREAIDGAKTYRDHVWRKIQDAARHSDVFPPVPVETPETS